METSQKKLLSLKDLNFKDKNVFMRVDFNVPIKNGKILDTYRIDKVLPSLLYILKQGGRVVLGSHLGRPTFKDNQPTKEDLRYLTLRPVGNYLNEKYGLEVFFIEQPDSKAPQVLLCGLNNKQVILLENLRFHPGEIAGDKTFAQKLASYTNIYINEGFSISHRHHASVVLLPKLVSKKGAGFLFQKEIQQLNPLLTVQRQPFYVFLGGSKADDKIPLLESLLNRAESFFIGGALAYTFLKAKGVNVGNFPVKKELLFQASEFIERLLTSKKTLWLPVDHIIARDLNKPEKVKVTKNETIPEGWTGGDIGPKTLKLFTQELQKCKTLFWNGPMGFFEKQEFRHGTITLAQFLASHKTAYRVVGGGHSALAVRSFENEIDHVSTGGGASLQYLQDEKAARFKKPGILGELPQTPRYF